MPRFERSADAEAGRDAVWVWHVDSLGSHADALPRKRRRIL